MRRSKGTPRKRALVRARLRLRRLAAGPFIALWLISPLQAQERFHRLLDADDGLNPTSVRSLAQDRALYLWIGTEGGLFRYDGIEMRHWARSSLDRSIVHIAAAPEGGVVAVREGGALFRTTADGARPVAGPEGEAIEDARDAAFDHVGGLWVVRRNQVYRRDPGGAWTRVDPSLMGGEEPRLVRPHVGDAVHLITDRGVWRLGPAGTARRLPLTFDPADHVLVDITTTAEGRVVAAFFLGRVVDLANDSARELFDTGAIGAAGRTVAVAARSGTIWVAVDRFLVGWREDAPPVVLGLGQGVASGGPLLIDHEGSLWMGSFAGLYQFPEPDAPLWTQRDGLPSNHVRYLARTGETIWVTSWQGAASLRHDADRWIIGRAQGWTPTLLLVDARGVLWTGSDRGILEVVDGRPVRRHLQGVVSLYGAHEEPGERIWLGTSVGLFLSESRVAPLKQIPTPQPEGEPVVESVLVDRSGNLWAASGETVCHAPTTRLRAGGDPGWRCETVPGAVHVSGDGLVEMPSGALWLSTNRLGVLRREPEGWEPVPGVRDLPSRTILSLVPARDGGLWVLGHGALHRVVEDLDSPAGWRIEERLSGWHGLPGSSGTHLLEDPDGGVWVTTDPFGVTHVPPRARSTPLEPPRVVLVDARVDDERVPLDSPLELPHDRNRLELRFAALSYRDPSLVRYQVRLSDTEPWVPTAGAPSFRWVDLHPGTYEAQVRASLDGVQWTATPARFAFHVAPPWYRRPWATVIALALLATAVYATHRLRVRHLLDLERQRTRIAMDLHDEIGSGLGSIGILSGLLASDGLDSREERRMAREIAATAGELGATLGQIVWTLDPRARTMEEIGGRLAELGRRLFADGRTEFVPDFPEAWPEVRPSQLVRRNVVLIGLEALHNAARHARARRVELRLVPRPDGRWELAVVDDGTGLDASGTGQGLGLRNLDRRAREIDAELEWTCPERGGTELRLLFLPGGRTRRARLLAGSHDRAMDSRVGRDERETSGP